MLDVGEDRHVCNFGWETCVGTYTVKEDMEGKY
jgi:hypothetical protein